MLHQYECNFNVNGRRTRQVVSARNESDARKLIESQYSTAKISWISVKRIG